SGQRVLIMGHQVIVNCMRYLLEHLSEAEILALDRKGDVPNCGVTSYELDEAAGPKGKLVPRLVNFVSPLHEAGAPVTVDADVPAAHKPRAPGRLLLTSCPLPCHAPSLLTPCVIGPCRSMMNQMTRRGAAVRWSSPAAVRWEARPSSPARRPCA